MRAIAFVLAALLLAGCATSPEDPRPGADAEAPAVSTPSSDAPAAGGTGPAWSFTATDGTTHSRDAPGANATVLFFMATWCGTCASKAPILADVASDYEARGVRTYSVTFDPSEDDADLRAWMTKHGQDWPHGVDEGLAMQRAFGVRSQSEVVVLGAQGEVVEHFGYGRVTDAGLRAAIDEALAA